MEDISDDRKQELISLVCRQTNYSKQTSQELLVQHKYDFHKVVKEYLSQNKTTSSPKKTYVSNNQRIYKELRTFLKES